jgi:hypothetical protein
MRDVHGHAEAVHVADHRHAEIAQPIIAARRVRCGRSRFKIAQAGL